MFSFNKYDFLLESIGDQKAIKDLLDKYPKSRIFLATDWHIYKSEVTGAYKPESKLHLARLIAQQKSIVKPNDIFIYLGDLAHKKLSDEYDDKIREFYNQLNGIKILIKGNHDQKDDNYYLSLGFNYVLNELIYDRILFTHRPMIINKRKDVDVNIHGHIHGARVYFDSEKENHLDVWSDIYKPISLETILNKKDKIEDENIDIYSKDDYEKLENRNRKEIFKYKILLQLFFKRFPKYKYYTSEEMYKNQFNIVLDFVSMPEVVKDEELVGWRQTKMKSKTGYENLSFKPVPRNKYEHVVILNKDRELIIDPCSVLIGKSPIYTSGENTVTFNWQDCYGFGYGSGEQLKKEFLFSQKRYNDYAKRNHIKLSENKKNF